MTTSPQQMSFLSEILEGKPIPEGTLVYFRERLRDRLHSAILDAFLKRSTESDLKRTDLADRIHRRRAQITRWFSTPSNLTLDSVSDLMVGLGMDFDGFPFTPIERTIVTAEQERTIAEEYARFEKLQAKILVDLRVELSKTIAALAKKQERSAGTSVTALAPSPSPGTMASPVDALQRRVFANVIDFAARAQRRTEEIAKKQLSRGMFSPESGVAA